MLHEILLSLSGHPSPLLRTAQAVRPNAPPAEGSPGIHLLSPPERELLAGVAHLSDLHVKLRSFGAQIAASHPSTICRAVATAIQNIHLAAFQRKVLEVEEGILKKDAGLVGAYNIVPLTAVVGEFDEWTRRMVWLWDTTEFMLEREHAEDGNEIFCTGAAIINRLRGELQTGYLDIEETARSLVRVAETAWVKQVSAWILYGRLPGFGADDFCVQKLVNADQVSIACFQTPRAQGELIAVQEFVQVPGLLPSFVTAPTAASMLFIGRSLNHIRARSSLEGSMQGMDHLSSQLKELSQLTYPLDSATFSRTITNIRLFLSKNTLQKLLPLSKVLELLQLLRDFFLLGRGEFAMALTQQADDRIRSRWRRADNMAHEKREGLNTVAVKEGEVATVLTKTWAAIGSMQAQQAEEDEGLERARDLLRLQLVKSSPKSATRLGSTSQIAATPFRNLLFSVPVILTIHVPSPLDLFLSPSDVQTYTAINSYLHSIRRAHLRLTDLWKITPLRRHHPPPPKPSFSKTKAGRSRVVILRERQAARMLVMRSSWTTCSAAIFFLAELEGYLQIEVVAELWEGFQRWVTTGNDEYRPPAAKAESSASARPFRRASPSPPDPDAMDEDDQDEDEDMWLAEGSRTISSSRAAAEHNSNTSKQRQPHDPQTLAAAHRLYLSTLIRRILLSQEPFTDPLYNLLLDVDQLVALVHRLQEAWNSIDLEEDMGVVDVFVDLEREEGDVKAQIQTTVGKIKAGIGGVIDVLRHLEADHEGMALGSDGTGENGEGIVSGGIREEGQYVPRRVGGVDRLLMKLDFGSWFDAD